MMHEAFGRVSLSVIYRQVHRGIMALCTMGVWVWEVLARGSGQVRGGRVVAYARHCGAYECVISHGAVALTSS